MPKVMCIKKCNEYDGKLPYWYSPEVGEITEVINSKEYFGRQFYDLDGYPEFWFLAECFATLPDSTADEMQEQSREAIVNIETVLA
jgi:hypothetical protein